MDYAIVPATARASRASQRHEVCVCYLGRDLTQESPAATETSELDISVRRIVAVCFYHKLPAEAVRLRFRTIEFASSADIYRRLELNQVHITGLNTSTRFCIYKAP